MRRVRNILLVLLATGLLFPACTMARRCEDSAPQSDTLKILTWNIFMLPRMIFKGQDKRIAPITSVLRNENGKWDVVVLEEVFIPGFRKHIRESLKDIYPYSYGPTGRRKLLKLDGGVMVLSRYPAQVTDSIVFDCGCEGSDCYSQKGAVFVQMEKNGKPFQLVGTHAQAMKTKRSHQIRIRQYHEIVEKLLKKHEQENVPQIIAGDLNTNFSCESCYSEMLSALEAEDVCDSPDREFTFDGKDNELVPREKGKVVRDIFDYILIRKKTSKLQIAHHSVRKFRSPWGRRNRDLADHYAVESVLILE